MTKPTPPTATAAEALSAALGFRRVVRQTTEQAADEQRMVLDEVERKNGLQRIFASEACQRIDS